MERSALTELKQILNAGTPPCVSLCMPKHRTYPEAQQDSVRLRNLLREAESRLKGYGIRVEEAERILQPVQAATADPFFWEDASDGLAAFLSPTFSRVLRLPGAVPERLVVTDRFHIKSLLPIILEDERYYLLALSKVAVRFFEGRRHSLVERRPADLPKNLADALRYDDTEKQTQGHRLPGRTVSPGTPDRTLFHGHGGGKEDEKSSILRYLQQVDRALGEHLAGDRSPLILAGVESIRSIYVEANRSAFLLKEGIDGNPDDLDIEALRKAAWTIVERRLVHAREAAAERFREMELRPLTTERATTSIEEIVPAAHHGRVDSLFVALDAEIWGVYDPAEAKVRLANGGEGERTAVDLLDLAAAQALLHGGSVHAVPSDRMPMKGVRAAAVLRF